MKNQYCGDVGDYGKYGLLRYFANKGIKVGINWYLTEDDGSNDGKFITYLEKEHEREYDPVLFDVLKEIVRQENKNIAMIEAANVIEEAIFHYDLLRSKDLETANERIKGRKVWHEKALNTLEKAELVFADPDNGIIGSKTVKDKEAEKYILHSEIVDYYNRGQNVFYYCQKARRTSEQWEATKAEMQTYLPEAKLCVLTYHRGTQRSYIFVIHPENYKKYMNIIYDFLRTSWGKLFTEEYINGKNPAAQQKGNKLEIELENGVKMYLCTLEDGGVKIEFSDQKNISSKMKADDFARYFR